MQDYRSAVGNESPTAPVEGDIANSHHARQNSHMVYHFYVSFKQREMQLYKTHVLHVVTQLFTCQMHSFRLLCELHYKQQIKKYYREKQNTVSSHRKVRLLLFHGGYLKIEFMQGNVKNVHFQASYT